MKHSDRYEATNTRIYKAESSELGLRQYVSDSYASYGITATSLVAYFPEELSLRLSGRTLYRGKTLYLLHAASYLEFEFEGKALEVEFESEGGELDFQAWIGIFINDQENTNQRIPLKKGNHRYLLWRSDYRKRVLIRIVKMSENQYASTAINRFFMDQDAITERTPEKAKCIEFIGDSITCGYGNEAGPGEGFSTGTENPWKAYGALAARKLGCDFSLVAWSGIGVLSSWVPEDAEAPNTNRLMMTRYPYVDYELFGRKGWSPMETYDYDKASCNLLVLNLGTNDASYTRDHADRIQRFQTAYQELLLFLRCTHQGIPILCISGAMTLELSKETEEVVNRVREQYKDNQIFFMSFMQSGGKCDQGADGHPSLEKHEAMAEELALWIRGKGLLGASAPPSMR